MEKTTWFPELQAYAQLCDQSKRLLTIMRHHPLKRTSQVIVVVLDDTRTGETLMSILAALEEASYSAVSHDNTLVAVSTNPLTASFTSRLQIWDMISETLILDRELDHWTKELTWSPDSRFLGAIITVSEEWSIGIFDVEKQEFVETYSTPNISRLDLGRLAWHPGDLGIACSYLDGDLGGLEAYYVPEVTK